MEILKAFFEYAGIGTVILLILFLCLFITAWLTSVLRTGGNDG